MSADASHEPAEGDDFLVLDDVLQVLDSSVQGHLLDGLSRLTSVLWKRRTHLFLVGRGGLR